MKQLLSICKKACREHDSCTEGYQDLLNAKSPEQIAHVWRKYLPEVVGERYSDEVLRSFPKHYDRLTEDFNRAGIYYNECPVVPKPTVIVIVGNGDDAIHIYGRAKAYVIGNAPVVAHDESRIHCDIPDGNVTLLDYSIGTIKNGTCTARNRSTLNLNGGTAACYDASKVYRMGGSLIDNGHFLLRDLRNIEQS